ncbi:Carnitine O-acetyltransferase mitochondrial, partial [Ascosphaera pollenicola]
MPAVPDESTASVFARESGSPAHSGSSDRVASFGIGLRQVVLRDRSTAATLIPFCSVSTVPKSLLQHLCREFNKEIERGDTYPLADPIPPDSFGPFWFSNFGAIMLLGSIPCIDAVHKLEESGVDWSRVCIGSFNIQPNYPGRSSHICSGTFLVNESFRNRGAGKSMGEVYLEWASQLGFTYTVFNVVYETNIPSCRIWDTLGFKRIGKIPGCGNLRSYPGQPIDGIIFGRKINADPEELASEERFDKIRYYLKFSKYPSGSDRAEKSRLRSAATHYKLIGGENGEPEKLMLKDKEVISDPQRQLEISRDIHLQQHAGINKTTATIALKYHWVRIKETVSTVIKNCPHCKDMPKATSSSAERFGSKEENAKFNCQESRSTQTYNPGYLGYSIEKGSSPSEIQMANSAGVAAMSASNPHGADGIYDTMMSDNES